jgi:hypothetical protein
MRSGFLQRRRRRGDRAELSQPFRARAVMQNWHDEFLYMRRSVDWGVLTYTMHPYVIGRGYRMLAFEDLLEKLLAAGAVFMTMEDAAREAEQKIRQRDEEI